MIQDVTLEDVCNEGENINATITADPFGISIALEGYETETGDQATILIEQRTDGPRVVIWADKTHEDPTHIISLENTKA